MPFDLIERRRQGKIIPRKKPLSQEVRKSIYLLCFALLTIIVLLSIVFLLNTSQSAQKGFILKQEQNRKEELLLQERELVTKIIEARAYSKIEASEIVEVMEKSENPIYIETEKE